MQTLEDQKQKLLAALTNSTQSVRKTVATIPLFTPFDASNELWSDYWARFITFTGVHSMQEVKQAQVFLTNRTSVTYKLLINYASQLTPSKDINQLSIAEIVEHMTTQFTQHGTSSKNVTSSGLASNICQEKHFLSWQLEFISCCYM